tara:strand:- start:2650 stop:5082 length:2433 start_codon:yes stop_codon:yes gene_type:complete
MKFDIKSALPHIISFVAMIFLSVFYFIPQFQGKELVQGDVISFKGASAEARYYEGKTGETVLWSTSMFGGMPTYQSSAPQKNNLLKYVERAMNLGITRPVGYFIFGMLGFYILMMIMGVSPLVGLIGAILFGLSTNHMILYEAGHMSKVRSIMSSPMIIAGVLLVFGRRYLLGGGIFGLFLGVNIYVNHLQMTYYLAMILSILTVIEVVKMVKLKDMPHLWKSMTVLALGAILALSSSASRIMTTLEYTPETVRGNAVLDAGEDRATGSGGGMEWERAMSWSNGTIDLLPSLIPYAAGGGGATKLGKDSALAMKLQRRGEFVAPMYHGDLTFTGGPSYFGAVAFFLFLLGAFSVKGRMKWWIVSGVLLTFMLSMGKNFPVINRLIFDYFPMFNKFRTPNSVMSVTTIFIPLLGMLGLYKLTQSESRETDFKKPALFALVLSAGLAILVALVGPMFIDFAHPNDARSLQDPILIEAIAEDRLSLLRSSSFRTALLIMISFGAIWLYIKEKVSSLIMLAVIGFIGAFDLYQIDRSYLSSDDFVNARNADSSSKPRAVDKQILTDIDPHYRVHDTTVDIFNSAIPAFHHKILGGYHPAKLQRYDDLIQGHIGRGNMSVLNMLNAKYIIVAGQDGKPAVQRNPAAMGNAWFVSQIDIAANANEEFEKLNGFDPAVTAIVNSDFDAYIGGMSPSKNGSISLTKYTPNEISYVSNSTSEQLGVFSEIWYGPDKGWQAYIDGQPVDHIRANYALRAMKIPAGEHEIKYEFKPSSYYIGETISLIASLLLLVAALGAFFFYFRGENRILPTFEEFLEE